MAVLVAGGKEPFSLLIRAFGKRPGPESIRIPYGPQAASLLTCGEKRSQEENLHANNNRVNEPIFSQTTMPLVLIAGVIVSFELKQNKQHLIKSSINQGK